MKRSFFLLMFFFGSIILCEDGNIDPEKKYAWAENTGWLNFRPTHGGAIVYDSFLAGSIWSENIGWIILGPEGGVFYENTNSMNWGVNRIGSNLSGLAWAENAGWINFSTPFSQVTLDPLTGNFDGFAWAENLGWISMKGTHPISYGIKVLFPTSEIRGIISLCQGTSADVLADL